MKRILPILLLGACLLTACHNDEKEIRKVAYGYIYAISNYQPTEARPYATPETCDTTLAFMELLVAHTDPTVYADNIPATVEIHTVTINDTTAVASYVKHAPAKTHEGFVHLVKQSGHWRVHEIVQKPPVMGLLDTKPRTLTKEQRARMKKVEIKKD